MKEEIVSQDKEFSLNIMPNLGRSQSMHLSSIKDFNVVPTIRPKGTQEWPSPMHLVKQSMTEIKEDEGLEAEENDEVTSEYERMTLSAGKAISNKNVINFSSYILDSTNSTTNSIELPPIKHAQSPSKRRSSILLSLENKRKNTMS